MAQPALLSARVPAAGPALSILAGIALASSLTAAIPEAMALLCLALPLASPFVGRGRFGRTHGRFSTSLRRTVQLLVCLVGGLLSGWLVSPPTPGGQLGIDRDRPVEIVVDSDGPWRRSRNGWMMPGRGRHLRQGAFVSIWRERLWIRLGGGLRPPEASKLRFKGYLYRSKGVANGLPTRSSRWRLWVKSQAHVALAGTAGRGVIAGISSKLRARVETPIRGWPTKSPARWMALALVMGDRGDLPADWIRGLKRTGLSHLLAISGLHVGLLTAMLSLSGAWFPRPLRMLISAAGPAIYLLMIGPSPGLVRASVMAWMVVHTLLLRRVPQSLNALICVATAMLLLKPDWLDDLGFRMTFAATAGIVGFGPYLERRWSLLPDFFRRPLAASVAAQLAITPLLLPLVHVVTPAAPLWNLVAVPWTALVLAASLALASLGTFVPGLAVQLLPMLEWLVLPFQAVANLRPALAPVIPCFATPFGACIFSALTAWTITRSLRLGVPSSVLLLVLARSMQPGPPAEPEVVLIDVGQGESILVRDGGEALLVDGGGWGRSDIGGRVLVPALARLGVVRLDGMLLTHPDADHCQGLVDLAGYLSVAEVWTGPGWEHSACLEDILTLPGVRARFLWRGERVRVGRWRLETLHPAAGARRGRNDRSLVVLAQLSGARVLLTGDVEKRGERQLMATRSGELAKIDVLKVAHHGSASSTGQNFLDLTRPRLALISAGRGNRYGHPSPIVLRRLLEERIPTLRTDVQGLVRVRFRDDGGLRIVLPGSPR